MAYRLIVRKTREYLMRDSGDRTPDKSKAGIFTEGEWEGWASYDDELEREELGTDEQLKAMGAPMLPGFEENAE